jgi:hypothetical protein
VRDRLLVIEILNQVFEVIAVLPQSMLDVCDKHFGPIAKVEDVILRPHDLDQTSGIYLIKHVFHGHLQIDILIQ